MIRLSEAEKSAECPEKASPEQSPLPNCNPISSRQDSVLMTRQEAAAIYGGGSSLTFVWQRQ